MNGQTAVAKTVQDQAEGQHWKDSLLSKVKADDAAELAAMNEILSGTEEDPETPKDTRQPRLPGEFWAAHPVLGHVRQAAHADLNCPDAVLLGTLGYLLAQVPSRFVVPKIVGRIAHLNLTLTSIGESGTGKGASLDAGRELVGHLNVDAGPDDFVVPSVVLGAPAGSAEGMVSQFFRQVKPEGKGAAYWEQSVDGVLFREDEVSGLVKEMSGREGSRLRSALLKVYSGENPSGSYVGNSKNYRLTGTFRWLTLVGGQPTKSAWMLDGDDGYPERQVVVALDPMDLPPEGVRPEHPGPLDLSGAVKALRALDVALSSGGKPPEVMPLVVAQDVAQSISDEYLAAKMRGGRVGHRNLLRLQVALAFGLLLDGKAGADWDHWELADVFLQNSEAVLGWLRVVGATDTAEQARKRSHAAGVSKADEESATEDRRLDQARQVAKARSCRGVAGKKVGASLTKREIKDALGRRLREYLAEAWDSLELAPEVGGKGGERRRCGKC